MAELPRPKRGVDILALPGLGRTLLWRWGRLLFQLPLLSLTALMLYDGFTGPQLAPRNVATVTAWVHYRGLVLVALLAAGNLFCMGCPFTLPRTLARRLSGFGRRWPRRLRSKWLAAGLLAVWFFLYEWFDLWASPWLTAWIIVTYFAAAFTLEALFAESPFCKYVCPLGQFNFVASTASPLQISVRDWDVCRTCPGKECVQGSPTTLGCGTELFPPQIQSNMDCIFCLDCARACPYENVALTSRSPLRELTTPGAWRHRPDLAFLVLVFAFASLSNAFGMVPPFYDLQARLAGWLGTTSEPLLLALLFGFSNLLLPAAAGLGVAWLSRRLSGAARDVPLSRVLTRYAPAIVPLSIAIWLAHYGWHFATGALTLIPVLQSFLLDHGVTWLGPAPNWQLGPILPATWLLPLQSLVVAAGFVASLTVADRLSRAAEARPEQAVRAALPWVLLFVALALAALATFNLPMEMRGTIQFPG
jgi:polyferredoxin